LAYNINILNIKNNNINKKNNNKNGGNLLMDDLNSLLKTVDSIAIFGILSIPIFRIGKDMGFPPFERRYFLNVIEFSGLVITG